MSIPQLFDAHTHVQFAAYDQDCDLVIARALAKGVWMVNVGTQRDTSARAVELANRYKDGVYAAVGLHPVHTERLRHDKSELGGGNAFVSREEEFDYSYYKKLAGSRKVVAIGECGLDYYHLGNETKKKQKDALLEQLELAYEMKKPLMIHCRNAFADLLQVFNSHRSLLCPENPGIIHFFSGTIEDAKILLSFGFSFSFGGVITFTRDYNKLVDYIPLGRIVSETDAPYVSPVPFRGRRNEPLFVREVVKRIAEVKQMDYSYVRSQLTENAMRIFAL
jgi:TatD DNase family protein